MDFSKIKLNNERNEHVAKRLNRLNTWNFFKVLYRENVMRLFGFSIIMIICIAPIVGVMMWGGVENASAANGLPFLNGFGFSTGVWDGLTEHYAQLTARNNLFTGLYCVAASLLCSIILSGGFAVIRDAFWTGKLSAVGVFKSMGKGIKASVLYGIVTDVILAFSVFGAYQFYVWASVAMPLWLAIVLLVLLCIVIMFVAIYLFILCSVATVYKQSVRDNLDDAWRLMWLNILPNIVHFLLTLIPIALFFAFASTQFFTIFLVIILMFGGLYIPLVWQTHMMKTFALFHPVEVKKKKSQHVKAEQVGDEPKAAEAQPLERKGKKSKKNEQPEQLPESIVSDTFDDEDVYAIDDIEEIADAPKLSENADATETAEAAETPDDGENNGGKTE